MQHNKLITHVPQFGTVLNVDVIDTTNQEITLSARSVTLIYYHDRGPINETNHLTCLIHQNDINLNQTNAILWRLVVDGEIPSS